MSGAQGESLKRRLVEAIALELEAQLAQLTAKIDGAREAAKGEVKSSAGDKYETGRAMMHLEEEMFTRQRASIFEQRAALAELPLEAQEEVTLGALVESSRGALFFSVGIGSVEIDGVGYLCLSPEAPLAEALWGAEAGDEVDFRGAQIQVEAIS